MPSPLSDDAPSELPRVGRYEILLELQDETFVSVMAARVRGPNTGTSIVELTKVEHTLARQAEVRATVLAEARAAGRVRHANFVHPTDTLVHEGDLYVATDFILGVRLDELLRAASAARFEIPLPVMLRILLDVVSGLSALHARHPRGPNVGGPRSIVHGDIAPTNILVTYRGDSRLLHSGLSCVTSLPGATGQRNRRLAYKAPEQLRIGVNAVPIAPAADVFAVGVLLWEVLQGRRLFDAPSDVEVVERILQEPLPLVEPSDRSIPIALLPLVEMALERTAERRIPNAAQLGDAIEHAPGVRLATNDEVALVVDQLVGPLIERRRERVNELYALAESRSPSDSTLRPAIISHLRQAGAMKTPVGLVYPPPSSAPLAAPTASSPVPSFVPSDRWIDPSRPPPSSRYPSDSRWPAPPSSGRHERALDRSSGGFTPLPERKSFVRSGWLYYLAIGAALGGLVFEYFIEATPVAVPQPTTVLAPPAGAVSAPMVAVPSAGAVTNPALPDPQPVPAVLTDPDTPVAAKPSPNVRPVELLPNDPALSRRAVTPAPLPAARAPVAPRVRRPSAPPTAAAPEGSAPAASESPPVETPQPTSPEQDWGI
jgi:eukaryotic-like serine/threonine-protein kinase